MVTEKTNPKLTMVSTPEQPVWRTCPAPVEKPGSRRFLGLLRQIFLLVLIAVLSVGSYFGISHFFLESVEVVGVSMLPTLQDNNHYLLNRWAFNRRAPHRGDVVVIRDPGDHGYSVKRVIALPGESIHFKYGHVYIDGREMSEPYLLPAGPTFTYSGATEQFITCGKDQYYVMGDNRVMSIDSRSYGPVSRTDVLGLVILPESSRTSAKLAALTP